MTEPGWDAIASVLNPSQAEREEAEGLLEEWGTERLLSRTQSSLLLLSDASISWFYAVLERQTDMEANRYATSGWMAESDFCFVNVRATGIRERTNGTFVQASKILPAIAANAIHLAPFTRYQFDVTYAIESALTVSHKVLDRSLLEAGIGAKAQVRAFVDACHLLGKTAGFDLEPHFAQFGRPVIEHPEFFRWIRVNDEKTGLIDGMGADEAYEATVQARFASEVRDIRDVAFAKFGIVSFEYEDSDYCFDGSIPAPSGKNRDIAYYTCIKNLIQRGLWPVLSHAWNGAGLPDFLKYDKTGNFPEFLFLDEHGENQGVYSTGVTTPIAFSDGIPANRRPDPDFPPEPRKDAINFYCDLFAPWREDCGFDFVRYDSVGHSFDSVLDREGKKPVSDRVTPDILKSAVKRSRSGGFGRIGALAERMGNEFEDYAGAGFDVVLGNDMLNRIDRPHLEKMFALNDRLAEWNQGREPPCAVAFAVDTHDTGSPHLWGSPLADIMGADRMRLRHFISRFGACGKAFRPKYEVMGFQDMSSGLYAANIGEKNLVWRDNEAFAKTYGRIETEYARFRNLMATAEPGPRFVKDGLAWWTTVLSPGKLVLVMAAALETGEGSDQTDVMIDLRSVMEGTLSCVANDFSSPPVTLSIRNAITLDRLEFLGIRLITVTKA